MFFVFFDLKGTLYQCGGKNKSEIEVFGFYDDDTYFSVKSRVGKVLPDVVFLGSAVF